MDSRNKRLAEPPGRTVTKLPTSHSFVNSEVNTNTATPSTFNLNARRRTISTTKHLSFFGFPKAEDASVSASATRQRKHLSQSSVSLPNLSQILATRQGQDTDSEDSQSTIKAVTMNPFKGLKKKLARLFGGKKTEEVDEPNQTEQPTEADVPLDRTRFPPPPAGWLNPMRMNPTASTAPVFVNAAIIDLDPHPSHRQATQEMLGRIQNDAFIKKIISDNNAKYVKPALDDDIRHQFQQQIKKGPVVSKRYGRPTPSSIAKATYRQSMSFFGNSFGNGNGNASAAAPVSNGNGNVSDIASASIAITLSQASSFASQSTDDDRRASLHVLGKEDIVSRVNSTVSRAASFKTRGHHNSAANKLRLMKKQNRNTAINGMSSAHSAHFTAGQYNAYGNNKTESYEGDVSEFRKMGQLETEQEKLEEERERAADLIANRERAAAALSGGLASLPPFDDADYQRFAALSRGEFNATRATSGNTQGSSENLESSARPARPRGSQESLGSESDETTLPL